MITTSGFDAFFWAFHAEVNFKLFKLSLKDFSFPVRLQTILTEILIIKLCLWSYQQMVEQDLPLVSYGFLTGFRGISDPAAPCTFNTGFRLTRSQVGRVGPLPATHFAKMKGKPNRVWIRKLYLCMIFVFSGKLVWSKYMIFDILLMWTWVLMNCLSIPSYLQCLLSMIFCSHFFILSSWIFLKIHKDLPFLPLSYVWLLQVARSCWGDQAKEFLEIFSTGSATHGHLKTFSLLHLRLSGHILRMDHH